jgi:hypothetical protein
MRWRQCGKTGEFIPIDESARREGVLGGIHGDIESFVSPVDGSIISDRKQLREHNKRNNVVNSDEFGTQHWDEKRKERDRFYTGQHTRAESLVRKQEIYETIIRAEREG